MNHRMKHVATTLLILVVLVGILLISWEYFFSQRKDSVDPKEQQALEPASESSLDIWQLDTDPYLARDTAFSPDGNLLACAGNGFVRLYDWKKGKAVWEVLLPDEKLSSVAYSSDGKYLAADGRSSIRIWDLSANQLIHCIKYKKNMALIQFSW